MQSDEQHPQDYGVPGSGGHLDPTTMDDPDDELQEEIVDDENIEEYMYPFEFKFDSSSEALERHREEKVKEGNYIGKQGVLQQILTLIEAELAKNKIKELKEQNDRRKKEELKERHLNEVSGGPGSPNSPLSRNSRWKSISSRSSTNSMRSGTRE